MKNTKENNALGLWEGDMLEKGMKIIKELSPEHFAKFSALAAVLFSIALWITRSMGYFYQLGRFSVYNIDRSYIDVWSDGFWVQVIQTIAVCIVFGGINYIYYQLSVKKQRVKKIGFVLVEFIVLIGWITWKDGIQILEIFNDLSTSSMESIGTFLVISVSVITTLNIYGIVFSINYKLSTITRKVVPKKKKAAKIKIKENGSDVKEEKISPETSGIKPNNEKNKKYIYVIMSFLIACCIELLVMYIMGVSYEKERNAFKFIAEKTELVEGDGYAILNEKNGDSYYYAYAVIYENQDVYILSRILKKDDSWKIDSDFLRVIDKKGVTTYHSDTLEIEIDY